MKEKMFVFIFILFCSASAFSMGQTPPNGEIYGGGSHHGGGGVPEPATILLILSGAGAAYVANRKIKDKK